MEGLLSFLLFAGAFFLMMRFGCGAHMAHGGHGHKSGSHGHQGASDAPDHADPVCGTQVPMSEGYGKMHGGTLYRFCSRSCLDKFESDPGAYLTAKEGQS